MSVRILITGGTFDKEYNMIDGKLHFTETHVPGILELGRCTVDYSIRTLMMVDSLEMTDTDREMILRNCEMCEEDKILITHGTDTLTETAKFLAQAKMDKTIVLTGAMVPYAFGASDALFNLGSALAFAQSLPRGVYIAMNGKFYTWDKVKKNKKTGFFEEN
ncbi:MAG: asparaginase [Chitinophagales bacterium]|nr:asparaginase [Bacteroidota bacterium]MCB9255668.1 asparaginase [Chitinophagales bacterium]